MPDICSATHGLAAQTVVEKSGASDAELAAMKAKLQALERRAKSAEAKVRIKATISLILTKGSLAVHFCRRKR